MSRNKHEPTDLQRQTVQLHATVGTRQEDIARLLGVDEKTLRLYYRDELDLAKAKANATIGGALFNKAKAGDTAAMIFWMKTQAGWRERSVTEHTGADGGPIKTEVTSDAAFARLASLMGGVVPGPSGGAGGSDSLAGDGEG